MAIAISKKTLREDAAKSLGLYHEVTLDTNTSSPHTQVSVPDLQDKAVDDERFQWSWLWRSASEWRLIASTDVANATITVVRAFDGQVDNGTTLAVYGLLSPDDWDVAINNAMQDKFYKDRITVPLVSGQKEYTPNASWLQMREQIIRMRWRDESSGSTKPVEGEVAVAFPVEANHAVTIIVPSQPTDATNTSLIIEARHYIGKLSDDTDQITLPGNLAQAAVKHEALKSIFQKMGPQARKFYAQQMVLTERDLAEQENRWLPTTSHRDWSDEDEPIGGDPTAGPEWGW